MLYSKYSVITGFDIISIAPVPLTPLKLITSPTAYPVPAEAALAVTLVKAPVASTVISTVRPEPPVGITVVAIADPSE